MPSPITTNDGEAQIRLPFTDFCVFYDFYDLTIWRIDGLTGCLAPCAFLAFAFFLAFPAFLANLYRLLLTELFAWPNPISTLINLDLSQGECRHP